jgi:hypothetical protein
MLITGTDKLLPLHIPKTSHYSHYISLKNNNLDNIVDRINNSKQMMQENNILKRNITDIVNTPYMGDLSGSEKINNTCLKMVHTGQWTAISLYKVRIFF